VGKANPFTAANQAQGESVPTVLNVLVTVGMAREPLPTLHRSPCGERNTFIPL
jgi:hypothetical protein